jgi:serine/threonine protein kinase
MAIACSASPSCTDYFSIYEKAKPLYAYQTFLSQFEEKSDHYALLVGKREIAALFRLIYRVNSIQNQVVSFSSEFVTCQEAERSGKIKMTTSQRTAKAALDRILLITNYENSITLLGNLLMDRLDIINDVSQPYFALSIPTISLKIAYKSLYSPGAVQFVRQLGFGGFGTVHHCRVMTYDFAAKTPKSKEDYVYQAMLNGAKIGIAFTHPSINFPYIISGTSAFSELGIIDCHHVSSHPSHKTDFLKRLSSHIENLLTGFSTLHLGFKKIRRGSVTKSQLSQKRSVPFDVLIRVSSMKFHTISTSTNPIVHGDFKPGNCVLFHENSQRNCSVGIIDLDTGRGDGKEINIIRSTYEYVSPEAAKIYKEPVFRRLLSIYDDSWALGCTIYEFIFGQRIFEKRGLKDATKIMEEIEKITDKTIDEKLRNPVIKSWIHIGYHEAKAAESYFNSKHPGRSLWQCQLKDLQRKIAYRELRRQVGIIRGLLTVNVAHRLTPDEAHNIYYMAERKLRCIKEQDFDDPIPHMGRELNFLNQNLYEIPLKIEPTVKCIQRAYRNYLTRKGAPL